MINIDWVGFLTDWRLWVLVAVVISLFVFNAVTGLVQRRQAAQAVTDVTPVPYEVGARADQRR